MAIVNNGTKNSLPDSKIPSGYTRPTVTEVVGAHYPRTVQLNVLKSTVENASQVTTMQNIIDNATIGITKQITDILAADFLATANVTAHAELIGLRSNISGDGPNGDFLRNIPISYICTVKYYVKAE